MAGKLKTNQNKYPFRVEEPEEPEEPAGTDPEIVWLEWSDMMDADCCGRLVQDGRTLRRARDLEPKPKKSDPVQLRTDIVSDSMGFIESQLPDMKAQLKRERIKGIEFKPDPQVPGFFQVHCSSEKAKMRYARSRGFGDHNSRNGSGGIIGPADIEAAKELVSR